MIRFRVIFAVTLEREQGWRGLELEEIENAGVDDQQCQLQLQHQPEEKAANAGPVILIHGVMEAGDSRHAGTMNRYISRIVLPQLYFKAHTGSLDLVPQVPHFVASP